MKKSNTIYKQTVPVLGMSCAGCASSVESMLNSQEGVSSAVVNFASKEVTFEYNSSVSSIDKLAEVIKGIGFELVIEKEEEKSAQIVEEKEEIRLKSLIRKLLLAIILSIPVQTNYSLLLTP